MSAFRAENGEIAVQAAIYNDPKDNGYQIRGSNIILLPDKGFVMYLWSIRV